MKAIRETAIDYHKKGFNCAQAVACTFADRAGVTQQEAFAAMEGFGCGMGKGIAACGALSAAVYIASLMSSCRNTEAPTSKKATYAITGKMTQALLKRCAARLFAGKLRRQARFPVTSVSASGRSFLKNFLMKKLFDGLKKRH